MESFDLIVAQVNKEKHLTEFIEKNVSILFKYVFQSLLFLYWLPWGEIPANQYLRLNWPDWSRLNTCASCSARLVHVAQFCIRPPCRVSLQHFCCAQSDVTFIFAGWNVSLEVFLWSCQWLTEPFFFFNYFIVIQFFFRKRLVTKCKDLAALAKLYLTWRFTFSFICAFLRNRLHFVPSTCIGKTCCCFFAI